jgi:MOSC domain-containing protein YiiM
MHAEDNWQGEIVGRLAGIARRERKRAPMETLDAAEISSVTGVAGDSRGSPGLRQVTVLSARDWQATCDELGQQVPWTTRRSNLLVDAMDLPREPGRIIAIGQVRLRIGGEISPCSRMDDQVQGLTKALQADWRGGVGCEVLQGGNIRIGDTVSVLAAEE